MSIRRKLNVFIGLPILLVYLVMMGWTFLNNRDEAIRSKSEAVSNAVGGYAAFLDRQFTGVAQTLEAVRYLLEVEPVLDKEVIEDCLRANLTIYPEVIGSCAAFEPYAVYPDVEQFAPFFYRDTTTGKLVSRPLDGEYGYAYWDWYRVVKESRRAGWTDPYVDAGGSEQIVCTYSSPIFRNDEFIGVVTIDVSVDLIRRCLEEEQERSPFNFKSQGIEFFMMSANGRLMSVADAEMTKETFTDYATQQNAPQLLHIAQQIAAGKYGTFVADGNDKNETHWFFAAHLPHTDWSLVGYVPERAMLKSVYDELWFDVVVLVVGMVIIVVFTFVVSVQITRPLESLAAFARKLAASGDLSLRVGKVNTRDEIAELATTLDATIESLETSVETQIREEAASRAIERELVFARKIQVSLLPNHFPPFPDRTEFELHAVNEPARLMAGDFYDYFFLDDKTLALVIADVSGKGPAAAMFMAVSRTMLRSAARAGRSPERIVTELNNDLCVDNDSNMFVTLFYAHYDVTTGKMRYVNAGHNPPYILRPDRSCEPLPSTGIFVAAMEDSQYTSAEVQLSPNDMLVAFTDGVTEAHRDDDLTLYGETRLEELIKNHVGATPAEMCRVIVDDVAEYSVNARHDDVTLLVLRRK
ncbi:MAG: SpoIIE family protein phosphatase [Thermoguttaceae bacterium]